MTIPLLLVGAAFLLILANGFFVAAEFGLVTVEATDAERAAASICREGAAQVLQDDPSIAGGSHSSGSRNNERRRRKENASANRLIKTWPTAAG